MADDFCSGNTGNMATRRKAHAARIAIEKSGGILISGTRRIDNACYRFCINNMDFPAAEDNRTQFATSEAGDLAVPSDLLQRFIEGLRPIQ